MSGIGKISNSSPATITTGNATFALAAGMTLSLIVGAQAHAKATSAPPYGGDKIDVVFNSADFADITNATAAELIAVLNRELAAQAAAGQPAAAVAALSGSAVKVSTVRTGEDASIDVVGGTALTALTLTAGLVKGSGVLGVGAQPSAPVFFDTINFTGDASVSAGGSPNFGAQVKAFFGDNRQVLAVIPGDCGGYIPVYVPSTDKLKYYKSAGSAAALTEATGDLSAVTFNLTVVSA